MQVYVVPCKHGSAAVSVTGHCTASETGLSFHSEQMGRSQRQCHAQWTQDVHDLLQQGACNGTPGCLFCQMQSHWQQLGSVGRTVGLYALGVSRLRPERVCKLADLGPVGEIIFEGQFFKSPSAFSVYVKRKVSLFCFYQVVPMTPESRGQTVPSMLAGQSFPESGRRLD